MTGPTAPDDDPLVRLTALPGVAEAVERTREACTQLRWHPALRRRTAEAQVESAVRGARASAGLDGAELPAELVRGLVAAQAVSSPGDASRGVHDAVTQQVLGALRATLAARELGLVLATAPAQGLAWLHLAAMSAQPGVDPDLLGRPRPVGVPAEDLVGLGEAPDGPLLSERLVDVGRLMTAPSQAPALVVAAVVHAELLLLRPFQRGNGVVARAVARALLVSRGLDPTGVAVPEVGLLAGGVPSYLGSVAAYGAGTADGVALYLTHFADAADVGAREGGLLADAVLAGRA